MRLAYFYDEIPSEEEKTYRFDFAINVNKLILWKIETDNELTLVDSNILERLPDSKQLKIIGKFDARLELSPADIRNVIYFTFKNETSTTVKLFIYFHIERGRR